MGRKVLFKYIFKETLLPFLISLVVFTGILFLFRVLKLVELIVSKNAPFTEILTLFSCVVPRFLEVALPMSTLLGVVIAFGRLSSDSEIVVVRASGMSLKELVRPVVFFSILIMLVTLVMTFFVTPKANHRLGTGLFRMATMQARSGLLPGVFNGFGPLTVYAENIEDDGAVLENIIISDSLKPDQPKYSVARSGLLISDLANRRLSLRLYQGRVFEGSGQNFNVTSFDIENVNISTDDLTGGEKTRDGKVSSELTMPELSANLEELNSRKELLGSEELKQLARYKVEWHRRIALPVACIAVALVAMCLGIQPSRGDFSWGMSATIVVGVLAIVLYYLGLALGTALGNESIAPAWLSMWVPNLLFFALAAWLFRQIGSENWLTVGQALGSAFERISNVPQAILKRLNV